MRHERKGMTVINCELFVNGLNTEDALLTESSVESDVSRSDEMATSGKSTLIDVPSIVGNE